MPAIQNKHLAAWYLKLKEHPFYWVWIFLFWLFQEEIRLKLLKGMSTLIPNPENKIMSIARTILENAVWIPWGLVPLTIVALLVWTFIQSKRLHQKMELKVPVAKDRTTKTLKTRNSTEEQGSNDISYLLQIADNDKTNLSDLILVTGQRARWIDNGGDPYLEFRFTIFNGSVFSIGFDRNIEGNVRHKQTILRPGLEFQDPGNVAGLVLPHGMENIVIFARQWLGPNIRDMIMAIDHNKIEFNFDDVRIYMKILNFYNVGNSKHTLKIKERVFDYLPS